ncbi:MAG: transcription-repair coupling factor, partial [Lachnospiraceae bacterium]|nr:transcription-repair coupling factor [Lachnospiraceae bacterium]
MKTFMAPLTELNEYNEIMDCLRKGHTPVLATGCIDSQKCHLIHGIGEKVGARVIITYNELKAKEIYEDYKLYDRNVCFYPAKDIMFFAADIHGSAIVQDRLKTLRRLLEHRRAGEREPFTVVLSLEAGMDRVLPLGFVEEQLVTIRQQDQVDLDQLRLHLVHLGYEKCGQVSGPGQFAVRGGILDIFPLTEECPYRIEFWDDEVDTIRSFDVASQRSIEQMEELVIYPAAEVILDDATKAKGIQRLMAEKEAQVKALRLQMKTEEAHRLSETIEEFRDNLEIYSGSFGIESYIRYFYENTVSFLDYFDPEDTIYFLDEPGRLVEKGEAVELEFGESMSSRLEKGYILPGQADVLWDYKALLAQLSRKKTVLLSTLDAKAGAIVPKRKYELTVKSVNPYNNNFALLVKELQQYKKNGYRVILVCASRTRAERISADLRE